MNVLLPIFAHLVPQYVKDGLTKTTLLPIHFQKTIIMVTYGQSRSSCIKEIPNCSINVNGERGIAYTNPVRTLLMEICVRRILRAEVISLPKLKVTLLILGSRNSRFGKICRLT